MQIFFIETDEITPAEGEIVPSVALLKEEPTKEPPAAVSIHSILGNVTGGTGTMRLQGSVKGRMLHILLDTGCSHNFLNERFSKVTQAGVRNI